jgi:hypothetical protein
LNDWKEEDDAPGDTGSGKVVFVDESPISEKVKNQFVKYLDILL